MTRDVPPLVVIDEIHHVTSEGIRKLRAFGAARDEDHASLAPDLTGPWPDTARRMAALHVKQP